MTFSNIIFFAGVVYSLLAALFWYIPAHFLEFALPGYILLGVLIFYGISERLSFHCGTLLQGVKNLASDMHASLPLTESSCEMGELARVLEDFRKIALDNEGEDVLAPVISSPPSPAGFGLSSSILFDLQKYTEEKCRGFTLLVESMRTYTKGVGDMTAGANSHIQEVSLVAAESSKKVQDVVHEAEELSASIAGIIKQVEEFADIARQASQAAAETDTRVNGLATAASKINDVVQLIQDIANQTYLLALNATIEAARAGEAGKGFAVVASEVKNLANQTAKATDDISDQIEEIQHATQETVQSIHSISTIIQRVNDTAEGISLSVGSQAFATENIAQHVNEVYIKTQRISEKINAAQSMAMESRKKTSDMSAVSDQILRHTSGLQQDVQKFVSDMSVH